MAGITQHPQNFGGQFLDEGYRHMAIDTTSVPGRLTGICRLPPTRSAAHMPRSVIDTDIHTMYIPEQVAHYLP
jgi:hypothetical protein